MAPGGTPASMRIWTRCQAITGDCSAGLSTTVLPVTRAATVMPQGMARGKFHGRNDHGDAAWNVLAGVGLTGNIAAAGFGQADHLPGIELAKIDRLGNVGVGLAPRLAALEDLPGSQLESSLPQDSGCLDQHSRAVAGGSGDQSGRADRAAAMAC